MNMRTLAVRSIRANPVRFVATVLAVVISTGFLAGTLVLKDSLNSSIEANTRGQLAGVDAAVCGTGAAGSTGSSGTTGGSTPGSATPTTAAEGGATPTTRRPSSGGGGGPTSPCGGEQQQGVDTNVPVSLLATVQGTQGVRAADGVLKGFLNVLDANGNLLNENSQGYRWIGDPALNPYRIVDGRGPQASGEVAIDKRTADTEGIGIGQELRIATSTGDQQATVVGIATYGDADSSSSSGDVLVSSQDAFDWLNRGEEQFNAIYVSAEPGTAPDQLVKALRGEVGATYTVQSGDELRSAAAGGLGGFTDVIGTALQIFAYIALLVSLFIIYNTFSIIVAQRTREFALLRALGARGGQVVRSVLIEAIVLGFIAAAVGFLLGIVFFLALTKLVPQVQDIAGAVSLKITPTAVIQVLVLGVVVTALSALFPALRAARTRPVEALRAVAIDRSGTSKVRAVIGLFLLTLGLVMILAGATVQNFYVMIAALPVLFLGVLFGGPILAAAFGWLVDHLPGVERFTTSRLGVENVRRNPKRAATTANALVIGVFLVVFVTAAGGALRDYAVNQLSQLTGPDFTVISLSTGFAPDYVEAVERLPGVTGTAPAYFGPEITSGGGSGQPLGAIDQQGIAVFGFKVQEGTLDDFGPASIVLPSYIAQAGGHKVGDPIQVTFGNGVQKQLTVTAIVEPSASSIQAFMEAGAALQADPALRPVLLAVTAQGGQVQQVNDELTNLNKQYSSVMVFPGNFIAQFVKSFFNFLISAVNALLSVAVVIALFGIVNTLVLSVSERTREIGVLRAVGMTRRQLRTTVRWESMVVSLLGALVGTAFGLLAAWCLTRPVLNAEGEVATGFSWPITQLLVILVLSVVLGIVASLVPAWRASRLNVLDAVTYE